MNEIEECRKLAQTASTLRDELDKLRDGFEKYGRARVQPSFSAAIDHAKHLHHALTDLVRELDAP